MEGEEKEAKRKSDHKEHKNYEMRMLRNASTNKMYKFRNAEL